MDWALVMACLTLPVAGPSDERPSWPQYGGSNRTFVTPGALTIGPVQSRLWRRDIGPGTSGIASDGRSLFTLYADPDAMKNSQGEEVVICLDLKSGELRWQHRYPVARLKDQESYTGEPIRPQATPAILGDRVCTLGYTGRLKCFDAGTGKVVWEYDLVRDFEATPVQFGFSASPLVTEGRFVVHVGGQQAAVIAFDAQNGKVIWKSKPAKPSYASPVVMPGAEEEVIIQVTQDEIFGLSIRSGQEQWAYPLPKPGLTNVPTPIVLENGRLLVSGQGMLGTRLLQITSGTAGASVREIWKYEKAPFFYTNWVVDGDAVYGAVGPFFGALGLSDGKELWRVRGQQDANLIRRGQVALVLRGDGKLSRCRLTRAGLEVLDDHALLNGRCWAAPTLLGRILVARSEKEITAVEFSAGE